MSATSNTESKNMKQALDPNGTNGRDSYWKMLEGAITEHRYIQKHHALNEICLQNDMINIIRTTAQDSDLKDSQILRKEITEDLRKFAYGN